MQLCADLSLLSIYGRVVWKIENKIISQNVKCIDLSLFMQSSQLVQHTSRFAVEFCVVKNSAPRVRVECSCKEEVLERHCQPVVLIDNLNNGFLAKSLR